VMIADGIFTNCIFTENTCNDCGGAPAGGAIEGGAITLEGCKFLVPANTRAGNNDILGSAIFACPPGTKATPVTLPGGPHLIKQLPPSTEVVHCAVVKYTCENGAQPNAKCVPDRRGVATAKVQHWVLATVSGLAAPAIQLLDPPSVVAAAGGHVSTVFGSNARGRQVPCSVWKHSSMWRSTG
jgi:hypothetical protein